MYLLDTNVVSEMRRRARMAPAVAAWASQVHSIDLYLSTITIMELYQSPKLLTRSPKGAS